MTIEKTQIQKKYSSGFNRFMYGMFVFLSLYFLLVSKDVASAMSNLGIALIFDPFNQEQSWQDRPRYQKAWLFVHLTVVFVLLGILAYRRFS